MKRILFVDDEPNVLQGLRRMLYSKRKEWEVSFALSGPEALKVLRKRHFDVVVSDMRMPGMDGPQFLEEVRKRHPRIVRIVLSGQSDREMALKSINSTHQFLPKPCDAETLQSAIKQAFTLRGVLGNESLKILVSRMETMPSLPFTYRELVEELGSPDASVKKLSTIISRDLGMTAKVLQIINSAFFGLRTHISKPQQAVSLLGIDTLRALVLYVGIFSQFHRPELGVFLGTLQNHSLTVGTLAKRIARAEGLDRYETDHAFMAGLIHDSGKLVLAANLPDLYTRVLKLARDHRKPLEEVERSQLNATPAEVGEYLLGLWGLHDSIIEAVAHHHSPTRGEIGPFSPLSAVHLANVLANRGVSEGGSEIETPLYTQNLAGPNAEKYTPGRQKLV